MNKIKQFFAKLKEKAQKKVIAGQVALATNEGDFSGYITAGVLVIIVIVAGAVVMKLTNTTMTDLFADINDKIDALFGKFSVT